MKTTLSLPDNLFHLAEATARRLRISRSEFYAKAISEFIRHHHSNAITARLNEMYSRQEAKLDSGFYEAQLVSRDKDAW